MNSFQNPDVLAIQRFKADVFILTKDRIKFKHLDTKDKYSFSAILDPRYYKGNLDILEDAVRNKKSLWLIIEVRDASANNALLGFSASGRILFLTDAHYVSDTDEIEDINPSKR